MPVADATTEQPALSLALTDADIAEGYHNDPAFDDDLPDVDLPVDEEPEDPQPASPDDALAAAFDRDLAPNDDEPEVEAQQPPPVVVNVTNNNSANANAAVVIHGPRAPRGMGHRYAPRLKTGGRQKRPRVVPISVKRALKTFWLFKKTKTKIKSESKSEATG